MIHRLPRLPPGFMSLEHGVIAYECAGDGSACPGAVMYSPIEAMCAHSGSHVACSRCPTGWLWDGNTCQKCEGSSTIVLCAFVVICVVVSIALLKATLPPEPLGVFTIKTHDSKQYLGVAIGTVASLTDMLQATWYFAKAEDIPWPGPLEETFLSAGSVFDLTAFKLQCAFHDPKDYAATCAGVVNIMPAVAVALPCIMLLIGRLKPKQGGSMFFHIFQRMTIFFNIFLICF